MVAVGREAHPRNTANLARIDPEGVAEIPIRPNISDRTECRPDRTSDPFHHFWIAFPAVSLRHRRTSVTAPRSVP